MMHFQEPARDGALLTELKEFGLLTPQVMEKIDRDLDRPETGTLNEFLLAGAEFISESDWLSWLIRQHSCHRFGRATGQAEALAFAPGGPGPEGNQPFRRNAEGHPLVAVLRPDRWAETVARLDEAAPRRAAATLAEMRDLHDAWRRFGGGLGHFSLDFVSDEELKSLPLAFLAVLALPLQAADLPPLNSPATSETYPGKFVWADLFTADQAAAEKFYTGVFNWTATEVDRTTRSGTHPYVILSNDGRPIAGIAVRPKKLKDEARGRWVGYVSVSDVPATLALATAQGGKIIFPSKDLPQRGTQAILADPEGALIGVIHSSSGDPGEYVPGPGDWVWAEHFARDPAAALGFDHTVLGYETSPDDRMKKPGAFLLSSGGYARGSVAPLPGKAGAHPAWLLFVRVTDIQAAITQVTALGGEVRVKARQIDPTTWLAVVRDPVGSAIGLIQLGEPAGAPAEPSSGGQP